MSSGSYFNLESWYSAWEKFKKVLLPLMTHFLHLTAEKHKKVLTDKNWLMGRKEENSGYYSQGFYFANKWLTVKAVVFPVVMSGCESWTIKQGEHWRTDAFELWHSKRLLRVPWTPKRSNQSILKEINPEYSLEGLMLKLKLQYFGHLIRSADSLEETLMLGKIEGRRRRGQQRMRQIASLTQWTWIWAISGRQWRAGKRRSPWGHRESDTP